MRVECKKWEFASVYIVGSGERDRYLYGPLKDCLRVTIALNERSSELEV